ncbi:alpha/beta hydrolase [Sphingobacterium sp. SYP-B4668]|uniref:alpha/beta hydrolase n=1 Tax=Sphingobacterium sp. SYP-B4668 TaxID=2996035 RepID=UPI0022DE0D6E|nr:alpha/beta hydrolase-fold protein [Sphingobacterium sp. SYP-B4668]
MPKMLYQVKVNILNNSDSFIGEPLYLAGTFNNWASDHLRVGVIPTEGEQVSIVLPGVEVGELELKVTRGSWDTLSSSKDGVLGLPHVAQIEGDAEITLNIDGWRDLFPKSTVSKQVRILDDYFYFPGLNVYKRVWIYLPKNYLTTTVHYPVIYMHDGQHLFDEATSVGRAGPIEWMVDKTIDKAPYASIVVAIDHAQDYHVRQQEFMVHSGQDTSNPQGWLYLDDIVNSLKPYVDRNYRTLKHSVNTAIVGSSLGGLISIYGGLKYPTIFGTVGAFSPSIWMDEDNLYRYSDELLKECEACRNQQKFYFYIGEKERRFGKMDAHSNMKLDLDRYYSWMQHHFEGDLAINIHPEGKHNAIYWQHAFKKFYAYWQAKSNSSRIKQ